MIRRLSDRFWNYLTDRIEARMHLRPDRDNTLDLGSSDYQWRRVYVGPGSVSAPAVTLDGDTDTGIYQSAPDNLDFATGGVQRLNISASGLLVDGFSTLTGDFRGASSYAFYRHRGWTLSNNGIEILAYINKPAGLIIVHNLTDAQVALIIVRGGANEACMMSDPRGTFSTTIGTAGKLNVGYSAYYGKYVIENKLGSEKAVVTYQLISV